MAAPKTAAATPIATAQRNSAPSGLSEGGDIRDCQGERPEAGPGVEADEDERSHPGGEQAGDEHDAQHRPAEPGGLHQQERPDERRAEQRADRGEASRRPDHGHRLRRRVLLDEMHGEHAEAAADRDQRRLRPEHDAEAQGRQRRDHDAGQVDREHRAARLESFGRLVTGGAGEVANRQRDEQACERRPGKRPPDGLAC